jgi:hypothetical protein
VTLLVASKEANTVWMVADTAVTSGSLAVRDREHEPKIIASEGGHALVGFAGGSVAPPKTSGPAAATEVLE